MNPIASEDSYGPSDTDPVVEAILVFNEPGNEVSDRQWNDALAVLKVQAASLDREYLNHWAHQLGVLDLLDRARAQESQPGSTA